MATRDRPTLSRQWRALLPAALLVVVAAAQVWFALGDDLSPWKGGGFGMFATLDGSAARFVRLVVEAPERSEAIEIRPSFEREAARAGLYPSPSRLAALAALVAAREARLQRPVETVKVQVWRIEYSALPRARERLVREASIRVGTTLARRP